MALDINLRGLRDLQARLGALQRRIKDIGTANREISARLFAFVIKNIDREGELTEDGWPPLQPKTVREKKRIGKEKIMVRSGRLRNSFTPFHTRNTAGVRSGVDYAAFHDAGAPSRNLPQRKLLPTPEQAGDIAEEVYNRYLARQLLDLRFNFTGTQGGTKRKPGGSLKRVPK